jgi:hypothetical protein
MQMKTLHPGISGAFTSNEHVPFRNNATGLGTGWQGSPFHKRHYIESNPPLHKQNRQKLLNLLKHL